jgi:lipopolysaccharide export LptBFGC system permease protein LptF
MMGRTLFWYIFRDLVKIFLMANGALAGIMSFGGLLRPLTHQGLDAGQVGKLLGYFNMAMLTYSLPIAALFATTVVYGRLSADNEITACRAGGLSHLAVTFPAFVLGILVAILSLVFLCFIVPIYTLKAEQVLYANFAKLIASSVQRTHQVQFGPQTTIFAQEAYIPPNSGKDGQQIVVLKGPTIQTMIKNKDDPTYRVPKDFYTASEATIFIEQQEKGEQRGTGNVVLTVTLKDGMKFPRQFESSSDAGVAQTSFGPLEVESPIHEDTKFMNVWRLKQLYGDPKESSKVKRVLSELVARDQAVYVADVIAAELNGPGQAVLRLADGEVDVLSRAKESPAAVSSVVTSAGTSAGEVTLPALPALKEMSLWLASQVSADSLSLIGGLPIPIPMPMPAPEEYRPITFEQRIPGRPAPVITARAAHLRARANTDTDTIDLSLNLTDVVRIFGDEHIRRNAEPPISLKLPVPPVVRKIANRDVPFYQRPQTLKPDRQRIGREVLLITNQVLAESNNRVSFAISCLVLVMVGAALGLMFRSGNYLTAFAISFIPALFTITLIVAGQRVSGSLPEKMSEDVRSFVNKPLHTGLTLIWTGNCVNLVLAVVLLGRLQRK